MSNNDVTKKLDDAILVLTYLKDVGPVDAPNLDFDHTTIEDALAVTVNDFKNLDDNEKFDRITGVAAVLTAIGRSAFAG